MTTTTSGLLLSLATFANVFLLVFQQQNVNHRFILLGNITSAALSFLYVSIILLAVDIGWSSLWFIVPAGMIGFNMSMWIHPIIKRKMDGDDSMQKFKKQQDALMRMRNQGI